MKFGLRRDPFLIIEDNDKNRVGMASPSIEDSRVGVILDDETAPVLIYHGLNGVYISEYEKWIRLDARGNKEGVNARFH